jgi:hypothetical protein
MDSESGHGDVHNLSGFLQHLDVFVGHLSLDDKFHLSGVEDLL